MHQVQCQRRQGGEDDLLEMLPQLAAFVHRQLFHAVDVDAVLLQLGQDVVLPALQVLVQQRLQFLAQGEQLFQRGHPVRRRLQGTLVQLALEPGDPDR